MADRVELTVAIAGLGAIGAHLARALDHGVEGLRLSAVAARDHAKARRTLAGFAHPPEIVPLASLAGMADIVVEAAPAAVFEEVATAAIEQGRIFVPSSVGALLPRMHLVQRARETGARIIVPTGALLGLDAVRAAAEGAVESVTIETRKPPRGLEGAPYLVEHGIDVNVTAPKMVFKGNAFDAARGFPANVNVAAALALAGIGPERTMVEIWADSGVTRNTHTIRVEAEAARLTMTIENVPSEENPRTGKITPLSILACLRGLTSTLKVGT
jgi:aspartate dehydrogenase